MAHIAAGLDGNVNNAVRSFADEVISQLFQLTPVDTGQLRYNWQVTLNSDWDVFLPLDDYASRKGKGRPDAAAYGAAERLAHAAIVDYRAPDILYISNAAPYAGFQNDGSDNRPPVYFVEDAVINARKLLTDLRLIG